MTPTVFDLRQYTLVPGRRDALIRLFDTHFVEGQEAAGVRVVGQFRDLDDPDRFVWIRGFASMPARGEGLQRFYGGPIWREHRDSANATMIDSDDALLVQPLKVSTSGSAFTASHRGQEPDPDRSGTIGVSVQVLDGPVTSDDHELAFEVFEAMRAAGAEPLALLVTHDAPNNFPALPLRNDHVLVWIVRCADHRSFERYRANLCASRDWPELRDRLDRRSGPAGLRELRLEPTGRSLLR